MNKGSGTGSGNGRGQLPPIALKMGHCEVCGYSHYKPKHGHVEGSPFLTVQNVAAFLGSTVSSIYSERSRGKLPPTLPGKSKPSWDPCVIAIFLYEGKIVGPTFPAGPKAS